MIELLNIGMTEEEIRNVIEINPDMINMNEETIENIQFLKNIECNDRQMKNIITCNPFYLSRSRDDLNCLISKLKHLGITNLNIIFDSNPWLLNKDAFEIDEYIEKKISQGMSRGEAIDLIDSGILD